MSRPGLLPPNLVRTLKKKLISVDVVPNGRVAGIGFGSQDFCCFSVDGGEEGVMIPLIHVRHSWLPLVGWPDESGDS